MLICLRLFSISIFIFLFFIFLRQALNDVIQQLLAKFSIGSLPYKMCLRNAETGLYIAQSDFENLDGLKVKQKEPKSCFVFDLSILYFVE